MSKDKRNGSIQEKKPDDGQLRVYGRIKPNAAKDSEMIVIQFPLRELLAKANGNLDLDVLVIANIPSEGRNGAPAYVKAVEPRPAEQESGKQTPADKQEARADVA